MNRPTLEKGAWPGFSDKPLTILTSLGSSEVERYAARELLKYLTILYGWDVFLQERPAQMPSGPCIIVGHPENYSFLVDTVLPPLSPDGFCLKTVSDEPFALLIAGTSGRGTLFGVYEFIERCGVQFLLSGDVFPEAPHPLCLAGFDECREPAYPVRALRPLNNLPEGSASWALSDFLAFIDQMAKLKFNTYVFAIMESGPWLDYCFRDMERPAGDIFYGYRYPIHDEFVGKELFDGQLEFYSPVLADAVNEVERKKLGIELVRAIIRHCKSRDLLTILTFGLLEPPTAFKKKCNEWASLSLPDPGYFAGAEHSITPAEEFGVNPEYAAWMNVADPVVQELTSQRLKALINTYPEADSYHLWVSEHRAAVVDYHSSLAGLDRKYVLPPDFDFEKQLEQSDGSPFSHERHQNQLKGDILFLSAFDAIFNEGHLLQKSNKPGAEIGIAGVMTQLAPVVTKVLPEGSVFVEFLDYGAHGPAKLINDLVPLLETRIPITLEIGIHDDNNMYFPQACLESLQQIVSATSHLSMKGYVAALWQIRQADINAAFLSQASWKPEITACEFYKEFLPKLLGSAASFDFEQGYRLIEKADREVRASALYGYAFLMNDRLIDSFIRHGVDRASIARVRPLFQAAAESFALAKQKASSHGLSYAEFWRTRTQFAVQWMDMIIACADLGDLLGRGIETGATLAPQTKVSALAALTGLLQRSKALITLIVDDAYDNGDLGQIASMNRHMHSYFLDLRAEIAAREICAPFNEVLVPERVVLNRESLVASL